LPLKTWITNFVSPNVSRVTGFHEFPNTALRENDKSQRENVVELVVWVTI
jgi:hypothetical protein